MRLGLIGGTGSAFTFEAQEVRQVETPFGIVEVLSAKVLGAEIFFIARHGHGHFYLSNMVNHRANIAALRILGVQAIIATTSCGVVDPALSLGVPIVFDDMYFPDNRLPTGEPCTMYGTPGESGRGHLIAGSHFSATVREALILGAEQAGVELLTEGCYAYSLGPRFNSKAEVRGIAQVGASMVSQTAGPESVLAGELEIPYALLGFGTDYANGVRDVPTPIEELDANIARAGSVTDAVIRGAIPLLVDRETLGFDTGFVYRFL